MKKIAFLVQKEFLSVHYGVRNYFATIKNVCSKQYVVDYLLCEQTESGVEWYLCDVENNYVLSKEKLEGIEFNEKSKSLITFKTLQSFLKSNTSVSSMPRQFMRCVGGDLEIERYDLVIITNPWTVNFEFRIPAKKLVGIVYDLIANQYSLTKSTLDFTWAYQHHRGYKYYNKHCDEIYAISEIIAEQYQEYYREESCKYFPPFPPYPFKDAIYNGEKKERAILLAAPFDPRKGIAQMPQLINGISEYLDTLYIYGMPRCSEDIFNQFFKSLKVKKIIYYPFIDSQELIKLYKKCILLLFPSLEEGLGFPIIEAQVCGCRVVTTNKKPMNTLCMTGSYVLKNDVSSDIKELKEILNEKNFDYKKLSREANQRFSYNKLLAMIKDLVVS